MIQWIRDNALKIIGGLLTALSGAIVYINVQSVQIDKQDTRMDFLERQHAADVEALKIDIKGTLEFAQWIGTKETK